MDYINIFNLEKKRTLENVGYVIKNGKYYSAKVFSRKRN